jgi:DNA-binding IclR family transcriptional regulator
MEATRSLHSVTRATRALELIAVEGAMGSSRMAQELALGRSTAYNLLRTLEEAHFVRQNPATKEFSLDWKLFELGQAVLRSDSTLDVALGALKDLAATSGETALLAVREGDEALYVGLAEGFHPVRLTAAVGRRTALHASASGKALLFALSEEELERFARRPLPRFTPRTITAPSQFKAEIRESRLRGYATALGEWDMSEASVSVPLLDGERRLHGALTLGGPLERFTPTAIERFAELLQQSAQDMANRSGYLSTAMRGLHR